MAHPRTLLREAVIAALTNATNAGARVYDSRIDPLRKGDVAALSVFTLNEPIDPDSSTTAPRELTRIPGVEIVGWVSGKSEAEVMRAVDDLALQVESVVDAEIMDDARCFSGSVADAILEDTTIEVLADNGHTDPLVGVVAMTYSMTYRTTQGAEPTNDFLVVDATHEVVGGVASTVPAEDTFNVRSTP